MSNHTVTVGETATTDLENFIRSVERNTEQIRLMHAKTMTNTDRIFGNAPTTSGEDNKLSEASGNVTLLTNALTYLATAIDQLEIEIDRFSNL